MLEPASTLAALRSALARDPDAVLSVGTGRRDLRPGFHVTEIRLADIRALDCGRRADRWREVVLEMTDDALPPGRALTAGALDRILSEAGADADPGASPVAELGSPALERYDLVAAGPEDGALRLQFAPKRAQCKAAARAAASRCCA